MSRQKEKNLFEISLDIKHIIWVYKAFRFPVGTDTLRFAFHQDKNRFRDGRAAPSSGEPYIRVRREQTIL